MKKQIYLVPYSHLDTQWRWEFPTTINKYIKSTIDENIYLFEKYPEHSFNFTGALRYQMMKDYYPERFKKVKKLIAKKRWHLAGTCLDETDTLVPSVESSIRNILYGYNWQLEVFGKSSKDYMIPDCFGFPENLPSVMAHCDINGFSSNKLTWQSANGIPFEIGKWLGPDGKGVVSAFNPCRYDDHLELPIHINPWRKERLEKLGEKNGVWKSFQYYGVGDIGGSPFESSVKNVIKSIKHYKDKNSDIEILQGSADDFFNNFTEEEKEKLDSYCDDLLLINHSAGTLTSAVIMKRWNRLNEQMAFASEAAAVTAKEIAESVYPKDAINTAWQRVIGSQMHDILPGTSTPIAYEYSQNDEVMALNTWCGILEDSAKAVNPHIAGSGNILLFNPTEYSRENIVTINFEADVNKNYVMVDSENNEYKVQQKDNVIYFKPKIEAFEWKRFQLKEVENVLCKKVKIYKDDFWYLENEYIQVKITLSGEIISIFDIVNKKELLKDSIGYEFQKERPEKFPAWNMDWKDRNQKPFLRIQDGEVELIEEGILKSTLKITKKHNNSTFVKEISLVKGEKMVRFIERINWFESGYSLKLAIPTTFEKPTATYNWETSRKERGINREKQFEIPSRYWVDLSEKSFGFSIIEDCKYGYDRPSEDILRMTLIYTPAIRYINGFWDQKYQDWGEHTIKYAFKIHDGTFKETDTEARLFNQPVRAFKVTDRNVSSKTLPFINIASSQVGMLALKESENGEGIIVRFYEKFGTDVNTNVTFKNEIIDAYEVNGLEEKLNIVAFDNNSLNIEIPSNSIKSYLVKLDNYKSNSIQQKQLQLHCNNNLFSLNNSEGEGSFPYELKPNEINVGNATFTISKNNNLNSMKCCNQNILLEKGYNKIAFLLSAKEKAELNINCLDINNKIVKVEKVAVESSFEFLGQWEKRLWKKTPKRHLKFKRDYAWINKCVGVKTGYVIRDRVGWYATHSHKKGKDKAYEYAYLYYKEFDLLNDYDKIQILKNEAIDIVGITLINEDNATNIKSLNDKYDF